jgi:hypothetical protein
MNKVLLVTVVGLIGCGVKAPIEARQDPYVPHQINLTSEDLRTHTAVLEPLVARDPAGLLRVTVPIRAATNRQLYIDYRVSFFDSTGQLINQTGWISKVLAPNVADQIVVNSTTPRAADFQIDVRYTRITN